MTKLADHKTKIVATIGPASNSPEMIKQLILSGLNVARLNFSHGEFGPHADVIKRIREAEIATGKRVAIMADLPGPKMRIGEIDTPSIDLEAGAAFTLTTQDVMGNNKRVSVSFKTLHQVVKAGNKLYLNDGLVHLQVERVDGQDVHCTVLVGGELRSRKGLNLPGINLGISAFTGRDRECLKFALEHGVDAVSQSFVEGAADIVAVREAAQALGKNIMIIAKIERSGALKRIDEILNVADGIMVARGDLGVEVPIQEIAVIQKSLVAKCNQAGKPVIIATQMLESMVDSRLPTRAEATDVANAILDGTDCVMLSAESAIGKHPKEAVTMLGQIASFTEGHRPAVFSDEAKEYAQQQKPFKAAEAIAAIVQKALQTVPFSAVFVPTRDGATARMISRLKPLVWTIAFSTNKAVCQTLHFSYGVQPVEVDEIPEDFSDFVMSCMKEMQITGDGVILVSGPSESHPDEDYSLKFLKTREKSAKAEDKTYDTAHR